ncbi:MAG: hypothetical protein IPI46_07200 [Bacteroidetes bacterium]|nr:hypothetical protein [Bacteroidota bacterium]
MKYKPAIENSNFPPEVQIIFTNKCATAGCHNSKSYSNAGGLDLSSWESLFRGTNTGACAIPFSTTQSSLLLFTNTYPEFGVAIEPSMPLNQPPLSKSEVATIKNWIERGCPNKNGDIPFATHASTRSKIYITNQGCDLVSVVDAETQLVMRYIKVGHEPGIIELPHNIKVSPDGKFWYVCFANGAYFEKYDATTDSLLESVNISAGAWNVIKISPDGKQAFISDLASNGRLAEVNLQTMTLTKMWSSGLFSNPHGIAYSQTGDTVYVTAQYGNMLYRIIPSIPQIDNISIQKGIAPNLISNIIDPHEVLMSPDYSKYFITCQASHELRVMDAKSDTLVKIISLGTTPLEMAISVKKNQLYVTCQEDNNTLYPFFKGSVYVVDINTLSVTNTLFEKFYQPHGLVVDDARDLLFVASRNANVSGPAPHHISECGGRNGYFHVIDLNIMQSIISGSEISVDPYSMDIRN